MPSSRKNSLQVGTELEPVRFANLMFRGLCKKDILEDDGSFKHIVTVNGEIIVEANRNPRLAAIINENWGTLDGQWPFAVARWRSGRKEIEKISGSDFVYDLCEMAAARDYRVFLLGARADVNKKARARLRREYGIETHGYSPTLGYPFPAEEIARIAERIEWFRPEVLVLAFGCPKQELLAEEQRELFQRCGVRWVIGVGGTLDFIAGNLKRAPKCIQCAGLESLWRLAQQPRLRFQRVIRAARFLQYA